MPTAREIDDNGFMTVRACPISSFGIFDYGAGQLGLPGNPMRIVKVYRPESAVNDPAAIDSFRNVPLINDHTMLSGFNKDDSAEAPETKGVDGVLTSNVYYEAPWMLGDLRVFSREMQSDINSGKKDLSLGYTCKFELKPGVFDGQPYEVVQTELRGNHIALVGEGRVPGARVLDGLCFDHLSFEVRPSDKETNMSKKAGKKAAMDNAVAQLKALLPALEQFLNEEAQEPSHQEADPAATANSDPTANAAPDVGVDPAAGAAAPNPAATNEPNQPSLDTMIKNVEDVLAQLKGLQPVAGTDGDDPEKPAGMDNEDPNKKPAMKAGDENLPAGAEENGKASPGPAAGTHATAADAAVSQFYKDLNERQTTYERLSKVVGAFDCNSMTAAQVKSYGVKKLGLKCAAGQEGIALDAYLTAVEKAAQDTKSAIKTKVADSAASQSAELDAYLKGNA